MKTIRDEQDLKRTAHEKTEFEVLCNMLVIHVNGELDHHNSVFIREKADEIICQDGIMNIIFDFAKTEFMDSSGIGVIMGRYKKVSGFGGMVGVVNVRKNVEKILLYSGLNKIIRQYDSLKNAEMDMNGGI